MFLHPVEKETLSRTSINNHSQNVDKQLVGRPLVPFFNEKEMVNDAMAVDHTQHETMDVDARVWNKDGYFEYPENISKENTPNSTSSNTKKQATQSGQIILDVLNNTSTDSKKSGKSLPMPSVLLTPQSVLSITKETNTKTQNTADNVQKTLFNKEKNETRSSSSSKKSKSRSTSRKRNQKGKSSPSNESKKNDGSNKGNRKSQSDEIDENDRTPAKNSTKPAKWAWSAFQSSPDPKCLPIPTFSNSFEHDSDDEQHPAIQEFLLDALPSKDGISGDGIVAPGHPPPPLPAPPTSASVELSMTEGLRKMLNIS